MPVPMLKTFAEKSGKSVSEVESIWDEAKSAARKKFKKEDGHFWAYVNATVQKQLGLKEENLSFRSFITIDKGIL
jgi:hypothetical protein